LTTANTVCAPNGRPLESNRAMRKGGPCVSNKASGAGGRSGMAQPAAMTKSATTIAMTVIVARGAMRRPKAR